MKTEDEVRAAFLEEYPSVPELVAGIGPFTWYLMGFRAAERAADEQARTESNEAAEVRQ